MNISKIVRNMMYSFGVVLIGSGTALAGVHIGGGNELTGPHSGNDNEWEIEYEREVDVRNSADLDNMFEVEVDTGSNEISRNTEVDDISTGDIWGDVFFDNELNGMEIAFGDDDFGDIDIDLWNDTTGPESENHNKVEIENKSEIDIHNCTDIDNKIAFNANTGDNEVENNTVVGDVETGDIKFETHVSNTANSDLEIDLAGISSNNDVNADMSNDTTGPNSWNKNSLEIENESEIDIYNRAEIDNEFSASANSGNNEIEKNTVVDDISTGNIRIEYHAVNVAN